MRFILLLAFVFSFHSLALAKSIYVSGRGQQYSFCNANSGSLCFSNIQRQSESEAQRNARFTCEVSERGRSITYTTTCNTFCSPNYLPPRHDGTWINCRSDCRMQCEVRD
ncbi:hypothetical protein [Bdellovibrio reynosensis]|uniref:Uncharacterized protein n=1 Tax=Bdellovibrio reynosensis TaxID=2835041 RepID=A0ABY4CA89_9BACT|nr:hypothetical protein [Bdellovibrio reynosensis]UOF01882.1 hypothetical protein MNR06_02800 [Bdellovibrio reynosensis]